MQSPSLGWQSWSPPFPSLFKLPRWDYSPFPTSSTLNYPPPKKITLKYWCSWYAYGSKINHEKIIKITNTIIQKEIPLTHLLIDDGWTTWGDWSNPDTLKFPDIQSTIKTIKLQNIQVGLWLTPFLASQKSKLFQTHPNWFIWSKNRPVSGYKTYPIWEEYFGPKHYLLNLSLPAVKKYITDFIDMAVNDWHVNLFKLDFLYAPYFDPNLKSSRVPDKQLTWLLTYIKTKYPNIITIACGAPFVPSIGNVDVIRISKDTSLPPQFPKLIRKHFYQNRIKILKDKTTITNTLGNFMFDPDVRMLSLDNNQTNMFWNSLKSSILGIGDDLTKLSNLELDTISSFLRHRP